ncbi:hypothetical protein [Streptomyces sp. NPDC018045]|uniref:hypothetical protein n=1 Tax=Streptomyces sp. NPDC018045 TaxID=3365037 RepID=UPI0037A8FE30
MLARYEYLARTELFVKAAFYMAMAEQMTLQRLRRGPVLRAMLSRRHGILQACGIVRAGRRGEGLLNVNQAGTPVPTVDSQPRSVTYAVVRHPYGNGRPRPGDRSGLQDFLQELGDPARKVDALHRRGSTMAEVPTEQGGPILVIRDGWEQVREVRDSLDRISRRIAAWADRYEKQVEQSTEC